MKTHLSRMLILIGIGVIGIAFAMPTQAAGRRDTTTNPPPPTTGDPGKTWVSPP